MTTKTKIALAEKEVNANYEHFKKMLPKWRDGHLSDFALLHKQKLVNFFESENDAIQIGIKDYGLGNFSVQPIQQRPVDLGHQSHALF